MTQNLHIENAISKVLDDHSYMLRWNLSDEEEFRRCWNFLVGATKATLDHEFPNKYVGKDAVLTIEKAVRHRVLEGYRQKMN